MFVGPKVTILCLLCVIMNGCNIANRLEKEEVLYDKVNIKIESTAKVENKDKLKSDLYGLSRPKPNKRFLKTLRPRLWYHYWGDENGTGIKRWMARKSEEPILLDTFFVENNCSRMETFLFDNGYYNAECDFETEINERDKEATVTYVLNIEQRTIIDSLTFVHYKEPRIDSLFQRSQRNTLLQKGTAFDVDVMKLEKKRIKEYLRDHGYFDFGSSSRNISIAVDSISGEPHTVDFYVSLNPNSDSLEHQMYHINDIYVDATYNVTAAVKDTQMVDGIYIIGNQKQFKPELLTRRILLEKGQIYALSLHRQTFDYLQTLGIYRFITLNFDPVINEKGEQALDVFIRLTPSKKMKYSAEIETSNRFKKTIFNEGLGVAGSFLFQNKNTFKGAERFSFDLFGGADFNINPSDTTSVLNTLTFSGEASLLIPKMVTPFPLKWLGEEKKETVLSSNVQTRIAAAYNFVRLIEAYSVNGIETSFGYVWQPNAKHRFLFTPVSISYATVFDTRPDFDKLLAGNIRLQKAFSNQLIVSGLYSWLTTNEHPTLPVNFYKFRGDLELAGNTLSLIENAFNTDFSSTFGIDYSQFIRLQADFRYYVPLGKATLVNRLYGGLGVPYGKATLNVLPYVRQYFSGGSTGLRAFPLRGIGPGTWVPSDTSTIENIDFERTGDIKLEANVEYRFPIYKWFKGAAFVDAGNVWTLNDTAKVGSDFNAKFLSNIGIGAGFGMRLDFTYFIMRVDLAIPLYIPSQGTGERWVIHKMQPLVPRWRKENLAIQLGIGYPF